MSASVSYRTKSSSNILISGDYVLIQSRNLFSDFTSGKLCVRHRPDETCLHLELKPLLTKRGSEELKEKSSQLPSICVFNETLRGSTKDLSLQTCCCWLRRGCCTRLDCVSENIDVQNLGTETWEVHVFLPMGLFLTCHKIMTVTTPPSPAAFGLREQGSYSQPWERQPAHTKELPFQIHSRALWHLLCTENSIFVTHLSSLSPLLLPDFRFTRQPRLPTLSGLTLPWGHKLTLPLPTLVPPHAPGLDRDEPTKGREGRRKETCTLNLKLLKKVWGKEE